ncbi:MAG: phytanoyl-CoA dioxygenase family protein [Ardenticatenaceae bacterium]|nr:phytanoyl-CoA dioxygenase family protein [Ardenticatenaceae bacterium]
MTIAKTETLIDQYEREGYVIVRNVLDADLIREAQAHIDWLLQKNPHLRPEQLDHHLITQDAFWVRLVSDRRLLDIAEQFLGPDLSLFASHYIAKPPLVGKAVPWHQDGSYWPLDPMKVVTFWLAIDRADEENGCMKVIPGTQHKRLISKDDYVAQGEDSAFEVAMDPNSIDESEAVNIVLNPGDVEIHHPNVFHGSHKNESPRWRRGLTIRYIPTSTRITRDRPHPAAFIFRGRGHANGNGWNPLPLYNPNTSMSFADRNAWNEKAAVKNNEYNEFFAGK